MRTVTLSITFLSLFIGLFMGCSRKPADVPALVPCKIIVKNGSSPVADVSVILGMTTGSDTWSVSGKTNSSGIADLSTVQMGWKGGGAPQGQYKITLSKTPKLERISAEEFDKMSPAEQETYNLEQNKKLAALAREIPEVLGSFETTPLTIEVGSSENVQEIDLSTIKKK